MPDELTSLVDLTTAPPVPFLPESVHGKPIVAVGAMYCGPLDAGEDVVRPLRTLAEPVADLLGPVPYAAMQQILDPLWQAGAHNYFTSAMIDDLSDAAVEELIARWSAKPTPQSEIHIHHAGGAMARVSASETAFSHRTSPYLLNVIARSVDGVGFDDYAAWARDTRAALAGVRARHDVRELHRRSRRGQGAGVLSAGDLREARLDQEALRPDECVPAEPEHRPGVRLINRENEMYRLRWLAVAVAAIAAAAFMTGTADSAAPRNMLPPPTTTDTCTPSRTASAIESAR